MSKVIGDISNIILIIRFRNCNVGFYPQKLHILFHMSLFFEFPKSDLIFKNES